MERRKAIKYFGLAGAGITFSPNFFSKSFMSNEGLIASQFGSDFLWGVATAACQIEGAANIDGKSDSVWDEFSKKKGNIKTKENPSEACNFYELYESDIKLIKKLNFKVFRFSLAWSRLIPNGTGQINQKGVDFYNKVINFCLENGIEPWVTLYHWDLPQCLEDRGGWKNREVINWFSEYVNFCTKTFGDRVKNWMVLNEPVAFSVLGYMLGVHAPGKLGLKNGLPAIHHTAMCQAEGGRIIRQNIPDANIGTTFSCSSIHPFKEKVKNQKSADKFDALLNRLFIEPSLGLGYPTDKFKTLKKIYKYVQPGDLENLKFEFDFIGIQNYTRVIAKSLKLLPILGGKPVSPKKLNVEMTDMGWEVYPHGIYEQIKRFSDYKGVKKIYITENGAAFPDKLENQSVHDVKRIEFYQNYLKEVLKAKQDGINVGGYFCWTLMDNFEWAEGYRPRFGLVYVDFPTQKRIIKDSGYWFKEFLTK